MEAFSALLAICAGNSPVTGEFPSQRTVTRRFDVFFYLCLNKRLSEQSWGWWFETPSRPLWRHCNVSHYKRSDWWRIYESVQWAISGSRRLLTYSVRNRWLNQRWLIDNLTFRNIFNEAWVKADNFRSRKLIQITRHNERNGISNHQRHDCLLSRLFRRWSKRL